MIGKLLVANRGEIARRIFRTCRALGVRTVAVCSDADLALPFVREADEAVRIGPPPSRESYLRIEAVLDAARRTGADAIHPGYGFLSENADFAEAVLDAGLRWVGPPPDAMRALGAKAPARQLAARLGVPTVPGYDGDDATDERLAAEALRVGLPVLIKASAGGGGRGMRRVDHPDELASAIASARREAAAAFGDDRLLVERYIDRPRHIEVQILADAHGNVVHLFERECSVQRRHQKILEEAPSPFVDPDLRARLGDAAVRLARAVGYQSAGTVEMIVGPDRSFHFLEMNTRLQVEHPVTEAITGLDLVALQIAVAEGRPLPFTQADLAIRGHAIEARVYAEDPMRDWLGGGGRLRRFRVPSASPGLRIDAGYEDGDEVGIHYDAMLAKVIAHGPDRASANRLLRRALDDAWAPGVVNNLPLLRDICADAAWQSGDLDTGFLARRGLPRPPPLHTRRGVAIAAAIQHALTPAPAVSPLGWRLGGPATWEERWRSGAEEVVSRLEPAGDAMRVEVGDSTHLLRVTPSGGGAWRVDEDGVQRTVHLARDHHGPLIDGETVWIHLGDGEAMVQLVPRFPPPAGADDAPGSCVAPTPGVVRAVRVEVGARVESGQALVVIEAMKMEHTLRAPVSGVVAAVRVAVGEAVDQGALLVRIEPDEA